MTRFLRFALVAMVICAMSIPASAAICKLCNPFGVCEHIADIGVRCYQYIDFCQDYPADCHGVKDEETLADLTIASVEVVTPAGVTKASEAPRVAAHQPLVQAPATRSVR